MQHDNDAPPRPRATNQLGVPAVSTPVAPTPEAVCASIGVEYHEGAKLDQVFATLDQNLRGKIDPNELKQGPRAAGLE